MNISVIIPYYEAASHIPKLVQTLKSQPYFSEVIVVDDCSSAEAYEQLVEIGKENNWLVLRQDVNAGPGPARNRGVEAASGDYIVFLDADDVFLPDASAKLAEVCTEISPDVVLFDVVAVTSRVKVEYSMLPGQSQSGLVNPNTALAYARSMMAGKCYRRAFILEHNIQYGTLKRHEDTAFTKSALLLAEQVYYLHENLYLYQISYSGLSSTRAHASAESSFAAFAMINKYKQHNRQEAIAYVYIVEVVLSILMKTLVIQISRREFNAFLARFDTEMPNWYNNVYLQQASKRYKLLAWCGKHRHYQLIKSILYGEKIVRRVLHLG